VTYRRVANAAGGTTSPLRSRCRRKSNARAEAAWENDTLGVAAEVIFLFEMEKILPAKEVRGGKPGDATTHDDNVGFACGVGAVERVAVADLMANVNVFAVNNRATGCRGMGSGDERRLDGTICRDGPGDDELDEIATRL
jgi:hypothetical protein